MIPLCIMNPPDQPKKPARRSARSRFKSQAEAGMRLEERDEQLLCDLFLNRFMSREQIQALYFTSLVRCNARLRQLFDHHFVARYYPPVSPFGAQAIYSVGKAALPLISRRLEIDLPEVTRHYKRGKTPTFIEHTLAIVDVWIGLRTAVAQREDVELESWVPEMLCRHEWEIRSANGGRWTKEAFKPDAFFRLAQRGEYANYFVEVDLGHTSSRQFLGKLMTHHRYLESGLFREVYDNDAFQTLVITTGKRRLENLRALVEAHNSQLFWFSTMEAVEQGNCLSAVWRRPLSDDSVALVQQIREQSAPHVESGGN